MIDLATAKKHLQAWLDAELAVSTGQSYSIGTRSLTRANLKEIRETITHWENRVSKLQGNRRKARRYIPRDL
ncbi:DUF6148 family protein [Paenibacillus alvei]